MRRGWQKEPVCFIEEELRSIFPQSVYFRYFLEFTNKDSAGLLSDLFPDRLQLVFESRSEGEESF